MVMVKHLQEPVPSVLDERTDLPAAVGRVVARAMAKLPGNRYQSVNELLEDLTIAAGMTVLRLGSAAPTPALPDEPDEITVVRPRIEPVTPRRAPVTVPVEVPLPQASKSTFNPIKILVPSAVALLVVFAVIYAFTRNSATTTTNTNLNQSLVADPNSQPVQPAQPATGKGEEGIPAGGVINPTANTNANANPNANAAIAPTPLEEISPVANENTNANGNSNRKVPALPEPTKTTTPETAPVPSPGGTKSPEVKPSPSPVASPNYPAR
jgi:hypothetical protein